ncbi:type 11 helix-turn-helix protein [Deinococcus phoenicis]|uniref:Type 11 helix-turn-helix protein n=1 Tax=Deinococcus phoenicis TaxID=1476583 RepID=A0A016QTK0_9DEIO|nr:WYL domain-containing protein [Deinococcus phoenicis]EYB69207.1 type 11 helix-turn-helix protein [Deinococcus phoenicis]
MGDPHLHETDPPALPQERSTWRKAQRLRQLEDDLRARPLSSRELAGLYGVPIRNIQRDLRALKDMGKGVEERAGRYSIPSRREALNAVEALTVHAAVRLLYHHAPAHNPHYIRALYKIAGNLPEATRRLLDDSVVVSTGRHSDDQALEVVARAWDERRVIRFDYKRPNGELERGNELCVYFVEVSRTNLAPYVIGLERQRRQAVRTFKLSRIVSPVTLRDSYSIPDSFNPRDHLTDAWGVIGGANPITVRVRFTPDAAYRVLEGGYPNASEPLIYPDGSVDLDIRAGADHTGLPRELLPWILSWGPRVEVLGPEPVRRHWLSELRAALLRVDPEFRSQAPDSGPTSP